LSDSAKIQASEGHGDLKFKIELEAVSPKEKALTPILKINIESDDASPETIQHILEEAKVFLYEFGQTMRLPSR